MRLLTLNCHAWLEEHPREKIKSIAGAIKDNQYDMIALQEVNQPLAKEVVRDNIKEDNYGLLLLDELHAAGCTDYSLFWGFSHIGYEIYEEGICIISRHAIEEKEVFFVSRNQDKNIWKSRIIVRVTLEIDEQLIDFYSCHLGWWDDEEDPAKGQIDALYQKVNKNRLSFIMGDFNNDALHCSEGYEYLINKGLYDTYRLAAKRDSGVTVKGKIDGWDGNAKDLRLDLILVNKAVKVKSSRVIFNGRHYPVVSDHFGVEIEIDKAR